MTDEKKDKTANLELVKSPKTPSKTQKSAKKRGRPAGVKNKAKAEEKPKKTRIPAATKEYMIARLLERGEIPEGLDVEHWLVKPKWDVWFYREDNSRAIFILRMNKETGIATLISKESLMGLLDTYFSSFAMTPYPSSQYGLSYLEIKSIASRLMIAGRTIKDWPEPVGFKSSPGYFFKRHDFDVPETSTEEQFPTIATTLASIKTNSKAFCARVGSLYDPTASRKQIIYLLGDGDSGKSTILNLLRQLVGGELACAVVNEGSFSAHGFESLVDKRLFIGDEIGKKFFLHNQFKRLTGDSSVTINPKGLPAYEAELKGILFCASNNPPLFNDDSGIRNRMIICRTEAIPKEKRLSMSDTLRNMRSELPYFIAYCKEIWSKYGGSKTIDHDDSSYTELIEDQESEHEAIFDENYRVQDDYEGAGLVDDPNGRRCLKAGVTTSSAFHERWQHISDRHPSYARQRNAKRDFETYVKKKIGARTLTFNLKKVRVSSGAFYSQLRVVPKLRILTPVYSL